MSVLRRAVFGLAGNLRRVLGYQQERGMLMTCADTEKEAMGLVLGVHAAEGDPLGKTMTFTKSAERVNIETKGMLRKTLQVSGPAPRRGEVRILYGVHSDFSAIAVVGMGGDCLSYDENEGMEESKEAVRCAAATGARALQALHLRVIHVEGFGNEESSAEGAIMGVWLYQDLKGPTKRKLIPKVELFDSCEYTNWQIGLQKAAAQNLVRQLCETPANLMTPKTFAGTAVEVLTSAGISVEVRVKQWAEIQNMEAFLAAAKGSCEDPIFLEATYYGCNPDIPPIVMIGKGVTFNSGGLCLKPQSELELMRGDMSGAAIMVAVIRAAAALKLPINLRIICTLSENMPGSCAMKPGDVVIATNRKSITVGDTGYDGRLGLADAIAYSGNYNPKCLVVAGSLTKATKMALGSAATGVFSNNDQLFEQMRIAGIHTGDRVWRLPLWNHYKEKVVHRYPASDVGEIYQTDAAPCSAAAFLGQFVPGNMDWIYLDTYGVGHTKEESAPYQRKGMTGRPTRTLIEFLGQLTSDAEPPEKSKESQEKKPSSK